MKSFFTPKEVAQIVGISYRQIQYWDKTNFIRPSYRRRGKYRLYTFADLIQLKMAKTLRNARVSIQRLRKTIQSLRSLLPRISHPLVELTFLIEGEKILVFSGEVMLNDSCGRNFVRFDVASLRRQVNEMFPDELSEVDGRREAAAG